MPVGLGWRVRAVTLMVLFGFLLNHIIALSSLWPSRGLSRGSLRKDGAALPGRRAYVSAPFLPGKTVLFRTQDPLG